MSEDVSASLSFYNAAHDLLDRQERLGTRDKIAVIDADDTYTYAEVERRVNRFANFLTASGIEMEQRILLCLADSVDFIACFLGAIKAGVVPVPVNTLLKAPDYAFMLADSRARLLVVSSQFRESFASLDETAPFLRRVVVSGNGGAGVETLAEVTADMPDACEPAPTRPDDIAFWLYTSGTTGRPKGVMHRQSSLLATADHFGKTVLQLEPDDVIFSPPKLFFAYGLGNALTFPFSVGATTVLYPGRPTPDSVHEVSHRHPPTVFFGVPTLYSMMLNARRLPSTEKLRLCISAGEALPVQVHQHWLEETGLEILDGLGSTEMLNTFLSNRSGDNKPGTSGKPVPGYSLRILADNGQDAVDGEMGDLYVSGPSSALGYWNLRDQSGETFQGRWVYTRDKYVRDEDGYYAHCGRSDDMLKVGGIYVSPVEVEGALCSHAAVSEAAVVGAEDADGLIKPKAFVVLDRDADRRADLGTELIDFVRGELAAYKRPRWIEFLDRLPKTATGKIQRHKLR